MQQRPVSFKKRKVISHKTIAAVYARDGLNCKMCGIHVWRCPYEEGYKTYEDAEALPIKQRAVIDHVVPIFHGGSNDLDNLQILCLSCNSRKGCKLIVELV